MNESFSAMGLDRITADLQLPVEPSLAARTRALLLRPATDVVDAAEAVLVATELETLADAAQEHPEVPVATRVALRRAAAVVRLRAGDDIEGVRRLLEVHASLVASWTDASPPTAEDVTLSLWCLATAAVAHREAGRDVQAAAAATTAREEADKAHTEGLVDSGTYMSIQVVLAFGAGDPTRSRGSIRALERTAIRLLGPSHPDVFEIRDMHGELMTSMGESRQAARHYAALEKDLTRDLGSRHELTVRARSSHAFALIAEGKADSQRRAFSHYRELADDVEQVVSQKPEELPVDLVAAIRRNWLQFLVQFGHYDEAEPVYTVAVSAARSRNTASGPAPKLRIAGGQMMDHDQEIAMLLQLASEFLVMQSRLADALPVLTELHSIVEHAPPMPLASASDVLFRLVRLLQALGRDAEAGQVLHDALEARSERHGWGSQRHVAALTIAAYLAQQRAGAEKASHAALLSLTILNETADPASQRHRPVLEAIRDGHAVNAGQLQLDD